MFKRLITWLYNRYVRTNAQKMYVAYTVSQYDHHNGRPISICTSLEVAENLKNMFALCKLHKSLQVISPFDKGLPKVLFPELFDTVFKVVPYDHIDEIQSLFIFEMNGLTACRDLTHEEWALDRSNGKMGGHFKEGNKTLASYTRYDKNKVSPLVKSILSGGKVDI